MSFTLYYFESCPFCQMVLRYLATHQLDVELKNTQENQEYQRELIAGGGKRQVPCLHFTTAGGKEQWLYESQDIIEYLEQQQNS